jgi:hypothetical protein
LARKGKTATARVKYSTASSMLRVERSRRGEVLAGRPSGPLGHPRATARVLVALAALIAAPAWAADEAPPDGTAAAAKSAKFSTTQVEQLVAPIALYPDALTVQVLMAATYPLEIVEAARWRAKNASLQGEALDKALEGEDWDVSVESLTHFPDMLQRMSDNLDWTKDLGDAFLGQKDEVLDAVQRLRAKAYEAGTLKTTKEQVVTREVVKEKEIITVEPADPEVVYVPQYSPEAVYGPSPTPYYYPSMMTYPPGYVATTSLLSFGAGMAVGAAVWGDCDWDDHDVYNNYGGGGGGKNQNVNVNVNREKNVDRSRTKIEGGRGGRTEGGRGERWQHNPEHRGGVRYRDEASAKKYQGRDQVAARDRANQDMARGYDRGQAGGGRPTQQPGARPGAGGGRPGGQPGWQGEQRPGGGAAQQPATRPGGGGGRADTGQRQGAFGGYESGRSAREASARGAGSRGGRSYAGGGGGGRGGGGFGGGGGGGRGGGGRGGGGRGGGGRGGRR